MSIKNSPLMSRLIAAIPFLIGILVALVTITATDKHVKETERYCEQYDAAFGRIAGYVSEIGSSSKYNRIGSVISVRDRAIDDINAMREVIDYFEGLKTPGSLSSEHQAVLAAIPSERRFLDSLEDYFNSTTDKQLLSNRDTVLSCIEVSKTSAGFDASKNRFTERIKYLKRHSSKYRHFIWI